MSHKLNNRNTIRLARRNRRPVNALDDILNGIALIVLGTATIFAALLW